MYSLEVRCEGTIKGLLCEVTRSFGADRV
jgi:hypothetical protein